MIEIENLSKAFQVAKRKKNVFSTFISREYETVSAISNLSFQMEKGEIVGYIGPNGAGKSTTIKIMSGILVPTSGTCKIMGLTPWKSRIQHVRNIGVVFGQRSQLWWDVPVIDSFELLKDIYKIPQLNYNRSLEQLVTYLELSEFLQKPVRQLSLGQRMRCEIAAALLHEPSILFLDEPTIGLDAVSKIAVRNFIRKINEERGVTVILTTHDMNDIEALANRIILIGKGKKLYDGELNALKNTYIKSKRITVDYEPSPKKFISSGCQVTQQTSGRAIIVVDLAENAVPNVIQQLTSQYNILDVSVETQPIEEVIVNMYKEFSI
ncbi:ABC transporter ATP-binding protein [Fusibacter bizertensis]